MAMNRNQVSLVKFIIDPNRSKEVFLATKQEGQKKILKDATCKFWAGAL